MTLNKYQVKLLKLKLLKTKMHKNQKNFDYLLLKNMETKLKKALHVIYKFHATNKKILFIGNSFKLNSRIKQLLKNKKHKLIPESIWMNGIMTNAKFSFKHLKKQHALKNDKTSKVLFNLKNQTNLIIVLNEKRNLTPLMESSLKRIPTVSLNTNYNITNFNLSTYKAPGDYTFTKQKVRDNIFFTLLNSLLKKKPKLLKKTWRKANYKKHVSKKKK